MIKYCVIWSYVVPSDNIVYSFIGHLELNGTIVCFFSYSVWKHIACNKLQLSEDMAWT